VIWWFVGLVAGGVLATYLILAILFYAVDRSEI